MKTILFGLTVLLLFPLNILAQQSPNPPALKSMIETEQAFSKTAEVKTAREAFMEFIADDGLLLSYALPRSGSVHSPGLPRFGGYPGIRCIQIPTPICRGCA